MDRLSQTRITDGTTEQVHQVPYDTLLCLYSQKVQSYMRKTLHMHRTPLKADLYYRQWGRGVEPVPPGIIPGTPSKDPHKSLLDLSEQVTLSPTLLARVVLGVFARRILPDQSEGARKKTISTWMQAPALIPHPVLAEETQGCIDGDDVYSPDLERVRRAMGLEHEHRLQEALLNDPSLSWRSEADLRTAGMAKTPDVLLDTPFTVNTASGRHVVNWIDSKAMFGDDRSVRQLKPQVWSYTVRYGPGLVIFWQGLLEDLEPVDGVLFMDTFPDKYSTLMR